MPVGVREADAYRQAKPQPADDVGIGVLGTGSSNVIEENTVSGNTTGIFIGAGARATFIRANTVLVVCVTAINATCALAS
jgi:parallel beta-helix repeat protein